ncbi:amino acid transporter AVT1C [Raphanus sativus]|uniref:Amino acid transporter AVT1C n=1 Tax=Raphanus sativus TaxID=3726 RepID=A0A9W3DM92_RAPSA|nr:amino acid transporter AVT1C [Raphanus sativus]
MNHVPSDQSFYIESEDEDDRKDYAEEEEEDGHSHSDSSDANDEHHTQYKPNSYTTAWPQSYRQSIDLYSSVPSPSIGFLGNNSMSRFGSSFLSSSLIRRHTPEYLPTVAKPLLEAEEQAPPPPKHRLSSHGLLPPVPPSRRSSMRKDERVSHEVPMSRNSSYGQAVMNGLNVLCGVGILSTPYAAKEGGWLGLGILFIYGLLSFYTGILLRYCLDSESDLETYPDIGQAAFGTTGRIFVSIVLYLELYACCVEYIILESDNLSSLYPNAALSIGGFELDARHLFALLTTIAVLPTVWLRDLSLLSYISAGGVIASVLVVLSLFWIGLVDGVGIHSKGTTLNLSTLPVAIGLYGYCYSGHAVFPNIYTSMANPNQYPSALLTCFTICTLMYAGVASMGYTMFGEATKSQFTLNLPQDLVATKVAVWTTVVNPFTKYALTLSPVALSLEELIPSRHNKSHWYAIAIRTALVFSTLLVGLAIPFFGLVMSLIGSLLTMLVTLILPPACFLSIVRRKVTRTQMMLCVLIIIVGAISSVVGSYSALSQIIEKLSS